MICLDVYFKFAVFIKLSSDKKLPNDILRASTRTNIVPVVTTLLLEKPAIATPIIVPDVESKLSSIPYVKFLTINGSVRSIIINLYNQNYFFN